MKNRITFQTRARTIDHLGRGQIADAYTAISELWKNAYDAYAKEVSLHIFEGSPNSAAIIDNGHGMTYEDFINRWLVVGTESKLEDSETSEQERFGLDERPRQGEKGIGRLSAAFLSPVTLILSKKIGHPYAAALVDWRFFENPFIVLSDLGMAVEKFDSIEELPDLIPEMISRLKENLTGVDGPDDRTERLEKAWSVFQEVETPGGFGSEIQDRISKFNVDFDYLDPLCEKWVESFKGKEPHGTVLFSLDINRELDVWLESSVAQDDEAKSTKERLFQTLVGFTDPYVEKRLDFDYSVFVHKDGKQSQIVDAGDVFDIFKFRALEHTLEGEFDDEGFFEAKIRCYGEDRGIKSLTNMRPNAFKRRGHLGAFQFCIGTFEQTPLNTTHTESEFAHLNGQLEKYGGIHVYRDGLRVLPYGRPDSDFFDVESRRGKNQGRYFWAHRRSFGRVAFSREENQNLQDKAGREGFVDNRARRELKLNVVNVLLEFTDRFFGRYSDYRDKLLPEIVASNKKAQKAAETARKRRRRSLNSFLKENKDRIFETSEVAVNLRDDLEKAVSSHDIDSVQALSKETEQLEVKRNKLRLPPQPAKLNNLEDRYREYRDAYNELCATLETIQQIITQFVEENLDDSAEDEVKSYFHSRQSLLSGEIAANLKKIKDLIKEIGFTWLEQADEDSSLYYKNAHPYLNDLENGSSPVTVLNLLDAEYHKLNDEFSIRYEGVIRSLEQIQEEIDLDGALGYVQNEQIELKEKVGQLNSLAQLGISVEIIGHELETLDKEVSRNLRRLPEGVKEGNAYKLAMSSHRFLVDRLRFLAPMKVSGRQLREAITGTDIEKYLLKFFGKNIASSRVSFEVTDEFRSFSISDLYSRIYPTFINIINNSLYWLNFAEERIIKLDRIGDEVFIADSGPGVDLDDLQRLFELFFTKRVKGRGVGLYLCRENLAASNHSIRYVSTDDEKILDGANFAIKFKGIEYDL